MTLELFLLVSSWTLWIYCSDLLYDLTFNAGDGGFLS